MDNNHIFDPLAWASANEASKADNSNDQQTAGQVNHLQPAVPDIGNELAKAKATTQELLRLGANIAESYDDYLHLGFALANGLGDDGRDLFHQLCAQSGKYNQADCEKKWQECLSKQDGRTTIASFYKMAQQAGVDLSAISRQFPSNPSNPHVDMGNTGDKTTEDHIISGTSYNNGNFNSLSAARSLVPSKSLSREGSEGTEGNASGLPSAEIVQYTETFSDKLDIGMQPSLLRIPVETQSEPEGRDKVILAALTLYSGAMPGVFGIYDGKKVYPPFYTLVDAPSGADKGVISDCRRLLMPFEWEIAYQYELQKENYQKESNRFFHSGNTSYYSFSGSNSITSGSSSGSDVPICSRIALTVISYRAMTAA